MKMLTGTRGKRIPLVILVGASFVLAGCASTTSTPTSSNPVSSPTPSLVSNFGTKFVPTDSKNPQGGGTVKVETVTYPDNNPCVSVTTTIALAQAPVACQQFWASAHLKKIPGQDLMNTFPQTKTFKVAAGVTSEEAIAAAEGYFRTSAFVYWEYLQAETNLGAVLDAEHIMSQTPIEQALAAGGHLSLYPSCELDTNLLITKIGPAEMAGLKSNKWNPSALAVASFMTGPCAGFEVMMPSGTTQIIYPNTSPAPFTTIYTGDAKVVNPLLNIFVINGIATCGVDYMKNFCATLKP